MVLRALAGSKVKEVMPKPPELRHDRTVPLSHHAVPSSDVAQGETKSQNKSLSLISEELAMVSTKQASRHLWV